MFRAPLWPSSGVQGCILLHMVFNTVKDKPYSDLSFTVLKTICSSVQPCTPEDGHNGARNMLSYWFINKS